MLLTAIKLAKSFKDHSDDMNFSRSNPYSSSNNMNNNTNNNPFPTVPSSLSAGDHGMREDSATQGAPEVIPRNSVHSLEDVRPYLGLRSRLSQIWANPISMLFVLVLASILLIINGVEDDIDRAKDKALSACNTVESIGSNMASMPHYLSDGVNQLAAHGVDKSVAALYTILFDIVTAAEVIFVWYINHLYGTYECLITFAVTGSLHVIINATEEISGFLNNTIGDIGKGIAKSISSFDDELKNFENAFNSLSSVFTGKATPPATLDLSDDINKLNNLHLPTTMTDDLNKLNNSIPNFEEVKNFTNSILQAPFEEIKSLMNKSLPNYKFDQTMLPVPERTQMSFCAGNNGITDFFDTLHGVVDAARKIYIAVLVIAALLICLVLVFIEIRRWRQRKQDISRSQNYAVDGADQMYIAARPRTAKLGIKISERFGSNRARNLVRWFIAYITSVPALFLLCIALAGFISCLCHYALLKSIEKEVPALEASVDQYADKIVNALNDASAKWANGTNTVIANANHDLNDDVFGWVNKSTKAVNDTLNTFVDKTVGVLNDTFGGTPLYGPIMDVYNCLIGLKIEGIEKGLTWVSDHAHIDFPMFPNDTFSAGAAAALSTNKTTADGQNNSFLADPTDGATDKISEAVVKLAQKQQQGLETKAKFFTAFLVLYLIIVLMGLARCAYSMMRGNKGRGEGGISYAGDVAPGTAENNAQIAATTMVGEDRHSRDLGQPRSEPFNSSNEASAPPPVYEPPSRSGMKWPAFRGTEPDEEEAYQNEKMGFAPAGEVSVSHGFGHARQSSYGEVINDQKPVDEKGFI